MRYSLHIDANNRIFEISKMSAGTVIVTVPNILILENYRPVV